MTFSEDGLYVRNGFAEGPLADAKLRGVARAAQLLDELQEHAETMTDAELRAGVHGALRYFTDPQPRAGQVDSLAKQIRNGVRVELPVPDGIACA